MENILNIPKSKKKVIDKLFWLWWKKDRMDLDATRSKTKSMHTPALEYFPMAR